MKVTFFIKREVNLIIFLIPKTGCIALIIILIVIFSATKKIDVAFF